MVSSTDPTFPLFPTFAFLGFVLSIIPLPWHLQAWNSGTCAFMIWTGAACLNSFVNSLVWAGNVENPAPVWCDISSKFIVGVSIGIPAATLCISRRLYYLTACNTVSITRDDKRRMVIVDLCIAVGIPAIIMALHYVVQGHRFDILEDIGCYPVIYNTLPAYFLYLMWSVVLGAISFVFSLLTLRSFWRRRVQFSQLVTSTSSMSVSRYLRLVILALVDMMCTVPLGVYSIYIGTKGVSLAPWISWKDTHFHFSRVDQIPAIFWRSDPSFRTSTELTRWLPVICSFIFFALFGFAAEAKKNYRLAFWAVMKIFGIRPAPAQKAPLNKGGYAWTKPSNSNNINNRPGSNPKIPLSLNNITPKKLNHSHSFSTSASTPVPGEFELGAYKCTNISHDIEKSAGLSPTLSDSDATTLYGNPPVYYIRPQPNHLDVPQDIAISVDNDNTFSFPSPTPYSSTAGFDHMPSASTSTFMLQHPQPKQKTSNSSMRTITSPDRDRFYISRPPSNDELDNGRSGSPSSPPPFVNSLSPERLHAAAPVEQSTRNVIQVMVHKTETLTSETI